MSTQPMASDPQISDEMAWAFDDAAAAHRRTHGNYRHCCTRVGLAAALAVSRCQPEADDLLIERLSDAAHEAWMESKHAQGIYSRSSEWGEDLMVPYARLSEQAKDLDRGTVRGVLAAIERAGMSVTEADR